MDDTTETIKPPLKPADATKLINGLARVPEGPHLMLKGHCKERLIERNLLMGDLLFLLKYGYVYDEGYQSTQPGYYKYDIEGTTPNSENRVLKAVVIPPCDKASALSIVTIMWKDQR